MKPVVARIKGNGATLAAVAGALISMAIGLVVLAGWIFDFQPFMRLESSVPMAPSTAILFILFSYVLISHIRSEKKRTKNYSGIILTLLATSLAILLLISGSMGYYFHLEHFSRNPLPEVNGIPVGHMSPVTAFLFVLTGVSMAILVKEQERNGILSWISFSLAALTTLFSYMLMVAYFFDTPILYGGPVIPPALSTSASFLSLSIALQIRTGILLWKRYSPVSERNRYFPGMLLLGIILLAGGIVSSGYFYFRHQADLFKSEIISHLSGISEMKIRYLSDWSMERRSDARIFYRNSNFSHRVQSLIRDPVDLENKGRIHTWMTQIAHAYRYDNLSVYDTSGKILLSFREEKSSPPKELQTKIYESVKRASIIQTAMYRRDSRHFLDILIPVFDEYSQTKVIGILGFRVDTEIRLFPAISHWPIAGEDVKCMLLRKDHDGLLILNPDSVSGENEPERYLEHLFGLVPEDLVSDSLPVIFEVTGNGGERYLVYFNQIPETPWFLASAISNKDLSAPLMTRFIELVALMIVLILISAGGVSALLRSQHIRFLENRLQVAEKLHASEIQYRNLLDQMMEGCQILSPQWEYLYINEIGARYGKKTREDLIGSTVMAQYPGFEGTPLFEFLAQCQNQRIPGSKEVEFNYPDGERRWFNFSVRPVAEGIFVLTLDITGRKTREMEMINQNLELERRVDERTSQLKMANAEMEAFVYSVSHDLRAPLRTINGFSSMLSEQSEGKLNDEEQRFLKVIRAGTAKMDRMITDLLALSRIFRKEIRKEPVDMNKLVKEVVEETIQGPDRGKISLLISRLPAVSGDSGLLSQVWTNLISNAVKYTRLKPQREIRISGESHDGFHYFTVADNGVGYNTDYAHRLFKAFQRLHSSPEYEGTGIGLAIVQHIVSRHGGSVSAESRPGEGASFTFRLPWGE